MIRELQQDAENRMKKSIESLHNELSKIRTGRAHPSLLYHIKIDYYGSIVPLTQVANVSTQDARTLTVQPWEKKLVQVIEKAILESDLGLNPSTNGDLIRIPIPALNEQRRKELVKVLGNEVEKARVAIRNVRRDANNDIKELLKDKTISEDDERRGEELIQKLTDIYIDVAERKMKQREADIMTV
jgi:ribosome recycling factor